MHDADDCRDKVRVLVAHVLATELDACHDDVDLEDLGLDSIAAMELMPLLREHLGLVPSTRTLWEARTIAELADLIQPRDVRA
jgi:acyl carrier protein